MDRYSRQIILPEVSDAGQQKLADSRVLIVGAGGLGCPVALYLAAAGIGKIGIVDGDNVEISNLHRQVLYTEADLGKSKAETAKKHLQARNSEIKIQTFVENITLENCHRISENYDLIVDCTDNFSTKYLLNDLAISTKRRVISAGIHGFTGTLAVFGNLGSLRCLFPQPPKNIPSCAEYGVLGSTAAVLGSMQAAQVINCILKLNILEGKFLTINLITFTSQILNYDKTDLADNIELMSDAEYHALNGNKCMSIKEISPLDLSLKLKAGADFILVDVREEYETKIASLGGILMPINSFAESSLELPIDKEIIIYCRVGGRSAKACEILNARGYKNVYNLTGGILNYADSVDPGLQKY